MKVQVLSTPGCVKCAKVKEMLDEMGVKYESVDITKKPEMLQKYPIMAAPGVVIDGKLAFSGVPSKEALKKYLKK